MVGKPTASIYHHSTYQETMFALTLLLVALLLVSILLAVESCGLSKKQESEKHSSFLMIGRDSYSSYSKKSKARLKARRGKN